MGKLRFTTKNFKLGPDEYRKYWEILHKARSQSPETHVYWEGETGEDLLMVRRAFMFVAARERIDLIVRKPRSGDCLELHFRKPRNKKLTKKECCKRILDVLANNPEPMRRQDIVEQAEISGDQWAMHINILLKKGKVIKEGVRIKTMYRLNPEETRN